MLRPPGLCWCLASWESRWGSHGRGVYIYMNDISHELHIIWCMYVNYELQVVCMYIYIIIWLYVCYMCIYIYCYNYIYIYYLRILSYPVQHWITIMLLRHWVLCPLQLDRKIWRKPAGFVMEIWGFAMFSMVFLYIMFPITSGTCLLIWLQTSGSGGFGPGYNVSFGTLFERASCLHNATFPVLPDTFCWDANHLHFVVSAGCDKLTHTRCIRMQWIWVFRGCTICDWVKVKNQSFRLWKSHDFPHHFRGPQCLDPFP